MPYLHWESYRSAEAVSNLLDEIKEDALKTRILRSGKTWRTKDLHLKALSRSTQLNKARNKPPTKGTNEKVQDDDDELLRKYLFKRWPIHLRRTLDQYYYSYLADTRARDCDQVVMRVRNEDVHHSGLAIAREQSDIKAERGRKKDQRDDTHAYPDVMGRLRSLPPKNSATKTAPRDDNSPIVMVDQLWLWVLDTGNSDFWRP